ncbi:hypothetical protein CA13_65540 [Planctomycetes bacterium CA13]|uniref:Uncharacterized protein n=1 Tax=Novipirellula herctigrandis TaxID=2527986 RepID=A0A5C5ZCM4_9BACT|nr:hypothetical protein CA13_73470 [Planctomycetes bacterium CA13]TWT85072.1 hypothetical protein CA13_65540 [Planctomycetes bacterium CA13]
MWKRIKLFFAAQELQRRPFVHPTLGTFEFDVDLGWKRNCRLDGHDVDVVIGSDGETPSTDMANTAADWVSHWDILRESVIDYAEKELSTWKPEWHPTVANRLVLSSINILWPNAPTTIMLYFDDPHDDIRSWHATFEGREPKGFAFDD